jgi:peroxiredoxin
VAFNQAYDQFRNAGAEVLAIGHLPQRQAQAAVADLSLRLPLLCDPTERAFALTTLGRRWGHPWRRSLC